MGVLQVRCLPVPDAGPGRSGWCWWVGGGPVSRRAQRRHAQALGLPVVGGRVSVLGRGLVLGGLVLAVQWWVITYSAQDTRLFWAVLAVPALVTGLTVARLVTVVTGAPRGGGYR